MVQTTTTTTTECNSPRRCNYTTPLLRTTNTIAVVAGKGCGKRSVVIVAVQQHPSPTCKTKWSSRWHACGTCWRRRTTHDNNNNIRHHHQQYKDDDNYISNPIWTRVQPRPRARVHCSLLLLLLLWSKQQQQHPQHPRGVEDDDSCSIYMYRPQCCNRYEHAILTIVQKTKQK